MMAYTKDNLQRLFQSKFNLSKWQTMMTEFFRADKVRIQPETLDEDAEERKGYFLGSTTTKDGYKMGFFYYDMKDGSVLRRKVGLRNLIRPYLGYGFDAALAVFDDGINWRLSLICDLKVMLRLPMPSGLPMFLVTRRLITKLLFLDSSICRRGQMNIWRSRTPSPLRLFPMISSMSIVSNMPSS